jgi:hypothetical protein
MMSGIPSIHEAFQRYLQGPEKPAYLDGSHDPYGFRGLQRQEHAEPAGNALA